MVEKNKNRIVFPVVRKCFVFLPVLLVLLSCITPASAEGIRNPYAVSSGWYTGLADATLVAHLVEDGAPANSGGFDLEKFVPRKYGELPQHSTYWTTQVGKEYVLYNSMKDKNVTWTVSNARKALQLNGKRYWVARSAFYFAPGDENTVWHFANGYKFTFEPFAMEWDTNIFAHMFEYDASAPTEVTVLVNFNDAKKLEFTMNYQDTYVYDAVGYVYPLAEVALWLSNSIDNGDPIYFNSIEISIKIKILLLVIF